MLFSNRACTQSERASCRPKLPHAENFTSLHPGGGGYLVYLSDGDVPFFRVSFSPIFSRTGYQKKANFLEQGEKIFCCGHILVRCTNLGQVPPGPFM